MSRRLFSILLTLCMLLSLVPAAVTTASAEGGSTVLAFTADVHNDAANTAANRTVDWIHQVIEEKGSLDLMGFCGDMGAQYTTETNYWNYVKSAVDIIAATGVETFYTTGHQEFYSGRFSTTDNPATEYYTVNAEAKEGDNYRIYCLGSDNWNDSKDNYTLAQIDTLSQYLGSVDSSKPIFIMSHYPLHSCASSSSRETTNASKVIEVLNSAAEAGKTIVFLWGHNHAVGDSRYDTVFSPGAILPYTISGMTKTFNFYYAAAGCMSDAEYGSDNTSVKGKGLVVELTPGQCMTFSYYNADGEPVGTGAFRPGSDAVRVKSLTVSPTSLVLDVGDTAVLTATISPENATCKYVTWKSLNNNIASVDSCGRVTITGEGTTYINVTTIDGSKTKSCRITTRKWSDPIWEWTDDYTGATATFTSTNDTVAPVTVAAEITISEVAPTCEEAGGTLYTATAIGPNNKEYTDTRMIETAPAIGHVWGAPTWTWAPDFITATATFVCLNDPSHVVELTVPVTDDIMPPTCEEEGFTTYVATVEFDGMSYAGTYTSPEPIPAIGHSWGEPTFAWAPDYSSALATFVCANDPSHTMTVNAAVATACTPATCEENGYTTYTATVEFGGVTYTDTKLEAIPAIGHMWGEPTWTWAPDFITATATFVCLNDPSHVVELTVPVTDDIMPPTCEEEGFTTYVATVEFDGMSYSGSFTDPEPIPATGHRWGNPTYEWSADNSRVTATAICLNDASHVETETVSTTYEIVTEPTTQAPGLGRYTAVFTNGLFETQTRDVEIAQLESEGHHILITDYTKGFCRTDIDADALYSGEVTFTVSCGFDCVVAIDNGDGTYTKLVGDGRKGTTTYKLTVADADVKLVIAFLGDATLNGSLTISDVTTMIDGILQGSYRQNTLSFLVCDFNSDGWVDVCDVTQLISLLLFIPFPRPFITRPFHFMLIH